MSGSCVDENASMSEVRGERADWLEIRKQQKTKHWVPLLSAKNRKRRLQFAQARQNWTVEDWTNVAWSDESRFLL